MNIIFFSLKHDYLDFSLKSSILKIYAIKMQSLQGSRVYSISFLTSKYFLMTNFVDDDWFVRIPMCNMKISYKVMQQHLVKNNF